MSNNDYSKLYVRIHSKMAAGCPVAIKLWYFCRAISNNGVAKFNINVVANLFKRTTRTIRSWLAEGLEKGYYRSVSHDNKGNYTVYYSSLFKLTKDWGHVTEIDIPELLSLRTIGIEIEAQGLQKQARCAAIYNRKESLDINPYQRKVRRSEAYIGEKATPSKLKAMGVLGRTSRYILLDPNVSTYGTTQKQIGLSVGRSLSTVYRALKTCTKVQLAQTKNEYYAEREIQAEEEGNVNKFFYARVELPKRNKKNNINNSKNKLTKVKLFKALNTLYLEDRTLVSMRYAARALRSFLK